MMRFLRRAHFLKGNLVACFLTFFLGNHVMAQSDWKGDWERSLQAAKKEGKISARPELRKQLEAVFQPKFGIEMELLPARGPQNASRIAAESAAGVKYFDVFIGGSGTYESLVEAGMVEPLLPMLILPEVKNAKNWWSGHIWEDNLSGSRYLYSYIADALALRGA
jgi:hypothetical protein